jgi:hypothetical protein
MKIKIPFNIQLSSRWKELFGLTSSTSPGKQSIVIKEFYGLGGESHGIESYGGKDGGHFLILKDQPIPIPIILPLSQDGNSQAEGDYLLSAPFLEGPDVERHDEGIIADINSAQIGQKLGGERLVPPSGMALEEEIAELANPGQDYVVVPEDEFSEWEEVLRKNRRKVKGEFLQEATEQRKIGSSLINGLEVQACHASSQPNSGIDLARQQQLPRSLSRIKWKEFENSLSLYLSEKRKPFQSWTPDSISLRNYGIVGKESYMDVGTKLWKSVDEVTSQVVKSVKTAIAANPRGEQDPADRVNFRIKFLTASIQEIKIKLQLSKNLVSISSVIGGSTSLVEDRLRGGRDATVILLLGMEHFIKTMSENYCFTEPEIDMTGIMMGNLRQSAWFRANAVVIDRCLDPDVIKLSREKVTSFLGKEGMSIDALKSICDYLVGGTKEGADIPFFANRKADHMSKPENYRFYMTIMENITLSVQTREPDVTVERILQNTDNYPEFNSAVEALTARIAHASCLGVYSIQNCARYVEEMNGIQVEIDSELTDLKNSTIDALDKVFNEFHGPFVDTVTGDISKDLRDKIRNILARHLYLTISLNRAYTLKYLCLTNELVFKEKLELDRRTLMIVGVINQNLANCLKYLPNIYNLYARKK